MILKPFCGLNLSFYRTNKNAYRANCTSSQVKPCPYIHTEKLRVLVFSLFIIFPFLLRAQAPPWAWAKAAYTNNAEYALGTCADPVSGDVVSVGIFNGDISAFFGSDFVGAIGGGFVAKYDPNGNVIWAFRIGNNQDDGCNGVAIDASGNIYVTGYVENIADFKGTLSTPSTILTSSGGRDMFIAKYDPAGQLLWAHRGGSTTDDEGYAVAVNNSRVFVTGYYTGAASFGPLSTVNGSSSENVFVVAYDALGSAQWLTESTSSQSAFGNGITCDNSGVYLAGSFKGSALSVYDPASALSFTLSNAVPGQEDGYVIGYSLSGSVNWASLVSSNGRDHCYGITQLGGAVYITGSIESPCSFQGYCCNPVFTGGSARDIFTAAMDKLSGSTTWVKAESGSGNEESYSIATDGTGNIFIGGYFDQDITFVSGPAYSTSGNEDVFVGAYDLLGNLQWTKKAGANNADIAHGITATGTGDVYVAGQYDDNAVFGPFTLFNAGSSNIFLARIGCTAITSNTIAAPQTICASQVPAMLTGSTPSGGNPPYSYFWEQSTDNVSWSPAPGTNNLQNYSPPALTVSMYFRRTVGQSPGCTGTFTSSSVLITVDPPPTSANAGPDQTICSSSSFLSGNTPGTGTGQWILVSGSGIISAPASPSSGVTALGVGVNVFQWVISNGVCTPSRDSVTITVDPLPTAANAGPNQVLCSSSTFFAGNTPLTGTGTWSLLSGTGTIISPGNPSSAVNGLSPGNNRFIWTITSGTCPSSRDTVIITVDPPPTSANAGPDQSICSSSTTFSGNTPTSGTGQWILVSGSGNITSPNSPVSGVTALGIGPNVFEWVITNSVCAPSRDTVVITHDAMPTLAYAGPDQFICTSSAVFAANLPVNGTGTWTLVSGTGTISNPNSPTSPVSALSVGSNLFQWKITSGTCPSSVDTVLIMRDAQPTASNAGPDQTICSSSTTFSANTPSVGTGSWSLVAGTGTIFSFNSPSSAVSGLSVGQNVFEWTITNGSCPSSRDTVIITVDAFPSTANAGPDQVICSSSSVFAATAPVTGTGTWSLIAGTGVIVSVNSPASAVNGLSVGQNIFAWTVSSGVCPSSRDTVIITVDANPTVSNAGPNQTICTSASAFSANAPVTGTGTWSLVSGSGTITSFNSPTSTVTGLGTGQNIFQWTISNGSCPSSLDTVIITVDAFPTAAAAGPDQTICSPASSFSGNIPSTGTGQWTLVSGTGTIISPALPNSTVTGLSVGQNIFVWTITNGTCPPSRDTLIITRDQAPTVSSAGPDQTICAPTTQFAANSPVSGTGTWSLIAGSGTINSFNSPTSTVSNLGFGQNIFVWAISNGTCPPSQDTVIITVDQYPTNAFAGTDQSICGPASQFAANTPGIGTGTWTLAAGTGTIALPNAPNSGVSGLSVGQNVFVWTIVNGSCPPSRDTVIITRDPQPSPANAGPDQTICSGSTVFAATAPLTGNGTWTLIAGTGSIVSFSSPTSAVNSLTVGQNVFVWTVTSGSCPSSTDTVIITVAANPSSADAGSDQGVCGPVTTLSANLPNVGTGTWTVISGSGTFANPNLYNTGVTGLSAGTNTFRWTITNNTCPSSSDDVDVTSFNPPSSPDAGPDQLVIHPTATLNANQPVSGTGNWSVVAGAGLFGNSADPGTFVSGLQSGDNVFRWTISNGTCADSTDDVVIHVQDLMVPNAFSPDGDGVNDYFEVKGLTEFDFVLLEVFNRWGNLVYKNSDYRNEWGGKNMAGADLSDDTYYYILKVDPDRSYNGYIILKRQ
jgi:gliding motility-associated-like protein